MLYLIGIGLSDEKDISVKGLEIVRKVNKAYLEGYTSKLAVSVEKLEKFYEREVIVANREMIENGMEKVVEEAAGMDIALLIIGDVFSATTHTNYIIEAKKKGVKTEVVHNASVLGAVGITGLQLYKFGKVTSIPFDNKNVEEPVKVLKENSKIGLHTLFLLDLEPLNKRYMTINEALNYLVSKKVSKDTLCVGCARLGSKDFTVKKGKIIELMDADFGEAPYCLIIPGKMHFAEEEALSFWQQ